jgi:hypothetical protein
VERFDGRLCDELLTEEAFGGLLEARYWDDWWIEYAIERLHRSLAT